MSLHSGAQLGTQARTVFYVVCPKNSSLVRDPEELRSWWQFLPFYLVLKFVPTPFPSTPFLPVPLILIDLIRTTGSMRACEYMIASLFLR